MRRGMRELCHSGTGANPRRAAARDDHFFATFVLQVSSVSPQRRQRARAKWASPLDNGERDKDMAVRNKTGIEDFLQLGANAFVAGLLAAIALSVVTLLLSTGAQAATPNE